jgi:hypothetical protein
VTRKQDEAALTLSCSFCGKSQREVRKLVAGPTVYICDECIKLCNDIIGEEVEEDGAKETEAETAAPQPPSPDRLLDIANGLRSAASAMRRTWRVEDEESVVAITEMADRIDALGEAIRRELSR